MKEKPVSVEVKMHMHPKNKAKGKRVFVDFCVHFSSSGLFFLSDLSFNFVWLN